MAATPVYEFTVPAPFTGSFTNGEKALAVASPMNTTPPLSTYYLARWLPVPAGLYTIKSVVDDAATWFAGVAMILSSQVSQGVFETMVFIPEDITRLDITLQNISTVESNAFVAFSLWQQGRLAYASTADGWYFDTVPIADEDLGGVSDPRRLLPVFPVLPNWQDGLIERLEWLTDILASETGAEMRRALRVEPRRTVEASFMRKGAARSLLDSFFSGVGQNRFMVPLWFEQYRPDDGIVMGDTTVQFPAGTLKWREFRANDLVIVMGKGPDQYDVLEVLSVDHGTDILTWKVAPARTWPFGSRIIPLRACRIMDAPELQNRTDDVGLVQVRFTMEEPEQDVTPEWIGGEGRLFPFRPNRATDIQISYGRVTYDLDNQTSIPSVVDLGGRSLTTTRLELLFFGRELVSNFRAWIGAARGRARRFYTPNFQQDIIATADLTGDQIIAKPMGFYDFMKQPQESRIFIAVHLVDGSVIYRRIIGITASGVLTPPYRVTSEIFTLDEAFDATIPLEDVKLIEYMVPTRFDQDVFEMTHYVDEAAALGVNVVLRSTDHDGMPPLVV